MVFSIFPLVEARVRPTDNFHGVLRKLQDDPQMAKECTDLEKCGKRREKDRGGWKLRLKDHV